MNEYLGLGIKESLGLDGWAESDFKVPLSMAAYWTICMLLLLTPSPVEVSLFSLQSKQEECYTYPLNEFLIYSYTALWDQGNARLI